MHTQITHYLAIKEDITKIRQMEAQILRAQRLDTIGALASGIAHDLNNILAPILLSTPLLEVVYSTPETRLILRTIMGCAERAAAVVKQLLAFSRGVGDSVQIQPHHLVSEICQIMRETFPKAIAVALDCSGSSSLIQGNPTQLHQVLLNLCVNARDAMPKGGTISISLNDVVLDESFPSKDPGTKPGKYVCCTISDTGPGISPEVAARLFEPFFTTKAPEHGTGLGLATARNIIRNHSGFITFTSKLGQGASFKVYLPAVETSTPPAVHEPEHTFLRGRKECILVVDDERSVLSIACRVLAFHGYEAVAASSGIEAIATFKSHQSEVVAAIVDMMMPGMDGIATIRTLRAMAPSLRVIVASGLISPEQETELARLSIEGHLSKPFTTSVLLKTVADVLHKGARPMSPS